jgi:hypothetical protein
MHLKVFLNLKSPKKSLSSGQIYKKKTKKPKKTHWVGLFFKKPGFFQPCLEHLVGYDAGRVLQALHQLGQQQAVALPSDTSCTQCTTTNYSWQCCGSGDPVPVFSAHSFMYKKSQ